jgi:hypothetical protein
MKQWARFLIAISVYSKSVSFSLVSMLNIIVLKWKQAMALIYITGKFTHALMS